MDKSKPDARMLLPLLLIPLLVPLFFLARIRRKRRRERELAAARALARRLAEERKGGRGKAKKAGRGGKDGAKAGAKIPGAAEAPGKKGFFAKRSAAYRKRLIRFVIMLGLERLIAARRAQMEEEFLHNSLLRRFSKAKDI